MVLLFVNLIISVTAEKGGYTNEILIAGHSGDMFNIFEIFHWMTTGTRNILNVPLTMST